MSGDTWQAMCQLAWNVNFVQMGGHRQFVEGGGGSRKGKEKGRK